MTYQNDSNLIKKTLKNQIFIDSFFFEPEEVWWNKIYSQMKLEEFEDSVKFCETEKRNLPSNLLEKVDYFLMKIKNETFEMKIKEIREKPSGFLSKSFKEISKTDIHLVNFISIIREEMKKDFQKTDKEHMNFMVSQCSLIFEQKCKNESMLDVFFFLENPFKALAENYNS